MYRSAFFLVALSSIAGCALSQPWTQGGFDVAIVAPYAETPPVGSAQDAADDPAIWVHPAAPGQSLVLGTDKKSGLHVYSLSGQEVDFLQVGNLNNVDVRSLAGTGRHFAAATNRTRQSITVFEISPSGDVAEIGDIALPSEPYGFCLGSFAAGTLNPVVTNKDGSVTLHAWDIAAPLASTRQIGKWTFGSQLEGCAVEEAANAIFIGEEAFGVWRVTHDNGIETARTVVDTIARNNGLAADVEGLDLWRSADGDGYLVVSAQSADRFVVYDSAPPHTKRGILHIGPNTDNTIDAVSHTDGLTVSSASLGTALPKGLLVVQDDQNTDPKAAQNFKLVDWQVVEDALGL